MNNETKKGLKMETVGAIVLGIFVGGIIARRKGLKIKTEEKITLGMFVVAIIVGYFTHAMLSLVGFVVWLASYVFYLQKRKMNNKIVIHQKPDSKI